MKKSWWCWFGCHDWEYIIRDNEERAWVQHQSNGRLTLTACGLMPSVHIRVCLSCGLKEDTYSPFIARREEEERHRKARAEQAKQLMEHQI